MLNTKTISLIIHHFYEQAKGDFLIGYHFRVIKDFDSHIPRIVSFWDLQLNSVVNKVYLPFDLIGVHKDLGIKLGEINRWYVLFNNSLNHFIESREITKDQSIEFLIKVDHFKEILTKKLIQP